MAGAKRVILISETGWKGMREFALFLSKKLVPCDVLIKGKVPREVLGIITPYKKVRISSISRFFFMPVLVMKILSPVSLLKPPLFVFSKDPTRKRMRFFLTLILGHALLLVETKDGYELYNKSKKKIEDLKELVQCT